MFSLKRRPRPPDELLHLIRDRHNVCSQIHLPAQSGSTRMLSQMRRGYSREAYLELVQHMRELIPEVSLSTGMCVCDWYGG